MSSNTELEPRINRLLDRAIALGLLEQDGSDVRATRRWKNALVAASFDIVREAEECPTCPRPKDPIGECVRRGLDALGIVLPIDDYEDTVALLTHFEIATMTSEKRLQNGYPKRWPALNS
jgi:hypothetical protein